MSRVETFNIVGGTIVRIDFRHLRAEPFLEVIDAAKDAIANTIGPRVYTLTLVEGAAHDDARVNEAMKRYVVHNKPFVAAAAVVGLSKLQRIVFESIARFAGRTIRTFGDEDEALRSITHNHAQQARK